MKTILLIQIGSSLVSIGAGVAIFRGWRGGTVLDRLGVASLPFTVSLVLWRWIAGVFQGVVPYWSGARLAAAMTVQHGYSLYSPATSGPVLGWIYPPISALAYLPATFLPDPALAIVAGRCLSLFYYYAPAALVLFSGGSDRRGRPSFGRLLLFLTLALISGESRPLVYTSTEVHADAPALGLAALAVHMVTRSRGGRDPWACAGALLLAMLSVWAKQLTIPILLIVLPAWILATGGLRRFGLFVLAAAVAAIGISLLILVPFEYASLGFNIWTVPSHHPWRIGWSSEVTSTLVRLQREHLGLLILLAVGALGQVTLLSGGGGPGAASSFPGLAPVPGRSPGGAPALRAGLFQGRRRREQPGILPLLPGPRRHPALRAAHGRPPVGRRRGTGEGLLVLAPGDRAEPDPGVRE